MNTPTETPQGPSVEELERLVVNPFEPNDKFCHWLDEQRPGYRLCGMRSSGMRHHAPSPSILSILETGHCSCGKPKCPACLRIHLFRRFTAPKKKRWWRR